MTVAQQEISVIVYHEDGFWIGQCLQFDISCQAKTPGDLRKRIMESIVSNIAIADDLGKSMDSIPPAPQKFWELFKQSKETMEGEHTPMRGLAIVPTLKLAEMELCA